MLGLRRPYILRTNRLTAKGKLGQTARQQAQNGQFVPGLPAEPQGRQLLAV